VSLESKQSQKPYQTLVRVSQPQVSTLLKSVAVSGDKLPDPGAIDDVDPLHVNDDVDNATRAITQLNMRPIVKLLRFIMSLLYRVSGLRYGCPRLHCGAGLAVRNTGDGGGIRRIEHCLLRQVTIGHQPIELINQDKMCRCGDSRFGRSARRRRSVIGVRLGATIDAIVIA